VYVRFDWDENKNRSNYRKHKVRFETAIEVFEDPNAVMEQDREVDGEERWQTIGKIGEVVLLIVAHTVDDGDRDGNEEVVRVISARRANRLERRKYENTN
jgi:uncharacterized protein